MRPSACKAFASHSLGPVNKTIICKTKVVEFLTVKIDSFRVTVEFFESVFHYGYKLFKELGISLCHSSSKFYGFQGFT